MKSRFHNYILNCGIVSANSHSWAYSWTAYKQAYLLSHFPVEFIGSYLSFQKSSTPKEKRRFQQIIREANNIGVYFEVPDINTADMKMKITKNSIMMGFENIKGLGDSGCEKLLNFRPFKSVKDLIEKMDNFRGVSVSVLKSMIVIGCFDSIIETNRAIEINSIEIYKKNLSRRRQDGPDYSHYETVISNNEIDDYLKKCFNISIEFFEWDKNKNIKFENPIVAQQLELISEENEGKKEAKPKNIIRYSKPVDEKKIASKSATKRKKASKSAVSATLTLNGMEFKL